MYRFLLFSDLDGTLIFSAAKRCPGDILVERKGEAEISCVTRKQAELLPGLGIIPVTTRSIEQYRRIRIPGFSPEFALVDNGGSLLINGEPDPEWSEQSRKCAESCSAELGACRRVLEQDPHRCFEIRIVDGLFLFTKSALPEFTLKALERAAGDSVNCFATGQKVYAIPAGICKGGAVRRLTERFFPGRGLICAGDSLMDIPMLNAADIAVFPEDMTGQGIAADKIVTAPRERFPEFVTEYFTRIKDQQE